MTENSRAMKTVIETKKNFSIDYFLELFQYADLIKAFVIRDLTAIYKQTLLGPLWIIIQPLLTTSVFALVFGKFAKLSKSTDEHIFLIYFVSNILWAMFAANLIAITGTFTNNAHIYGKVYFPRLTAPIAIIFKNLILFAFQFIIFVLFYVYSIDLKPNLTVLLMHVLTGLSALFDIVLLSFGTGLILSTMVVKYKDMNVLIGFLIQMMLFLSPVLYAVSDIPIHLQKFYVLNPLAPIFEKWKFAFFGGEYAIHAWNAISMTIPIVTCILGVVFFIRKEKNFIDYI